MLHGRNAIEDDDVVCCLRWQVIRYYIKLFVLKTLENHVLYK